jgi:hypothetical protein
MEAKSLTAASRLRTDHADLEAEVECLRRSLDQPEGGSSSKLHGFSLALNRFIGRYLHHIDDEEANLLPIPYDVFTDAELAIVSQQSVAATTPSDQAMMLGHMFPAMRALDLRTFFDNLRAKAPMEAVQYLEELARRK